MRRVLVTGATGFIGRHLTAALAGRFDIVAAVRRRDQLQSRAQVVAVGDIDRATTWDAALGDVDAVVHLAGIAHRHAQPATDSDLYREVNTLGTLALANAAARKGIKDLVFVSSIIVNGTSTGRRGPFSELDPPEPRDAYAVSKAEAETGLQAIAAESGLACTIVRPVLVYGSGASGNIAQLARAFGRNLPLPLASISNRRAFVSVSNLSDFIAWRLGRPNRGAETFIVADEGHLSTPEFVAGLAAATGRRARLFPFPPGLLASGLKAVGRGGLVDSLMASLEVDTGKARAAGWRPLHDTRTGLRLEFGGGDGAGEPAGANRS